MADKPGTLFQLACENEEAIEITIVGLFPSADALEQQIQGADERSKDVRGSPTIAEKKETLFDRYSIGVIN